MTAGARADVLRADGAEAHRVTFFELFFDLVYVFAVTQLSHGLLEHLSLEGIGQTLLLLLAVWWAWVYTTWATNWVNPDSRPVRLMLIGVMASVFVMATALPEAFEERGLLFAGAYAAIQVGRSSFVLWAVRADPVRRSNFQRIVIWNMVVSAIWVAGGLADPEARRVIWVAALALDYLAPAARFWVPGLGASQTGDWTVTGSYFAERFKLFVILALGESVVVTGITFTGMQITAQSAAAFAVAFVGAVTLWWIYFDRSAEMGLLSMERSTDPGAVARLAYTYFHLPMVAGVIVTAVADELIIAHPESHGDLATMATTLGGPALFLAGHALYRWAVIGRVAVSHVVAVVVLAGALAFSSDVPALWLGAGATAVLLVVAAIESLRGPALVEG
jgi:low temperature requirement protein LtrA